MAKAKVKGIGMVYLRVDHRVSPPAFVYVLAGIGLEDNMVYYLDQEVSPFTWRKVITQMEGKKNV